MRSRFTVVLAAATFILTVVSTASWAKEAPTQPSTHKIIGHKMLESKKRREPVPVQPVIHDGILYEAPWEGSPYGYTLDGGILVARDSKTQELLWSRKIYTSEQNASIESDKHDVFISSIALADDKASLLIENEAGDKFRFLFATSLIVENNAK